MKARPKTFIKTKRLSYRFCLCQNQCKNWNWIQNCQHYQSNCSNFIFFFFCFWLLKIEKHMLYIFKFVLVSENESDIYKFLHFCQKGGNKVENTNWFLKFSWPGNLVRLFHWWFIIKNIVGGTKMIWHKSLVWQTLPQWNCIMAIWRYAS